MFLAPLTPAAGAEPVPDPVAVAVGITVPGDGHEGLLVDIDPDPVTVPVRAELQRRTGGAWRLEAPLTISNARGRLSVEPLAGRYRVVVPAAPGFTAAASEPITYAGPRSRARVGLVQNSYLFASVRTTTTGADPWTVRLERREGGVWRPVRIASVAPGGELLHDATRGWYRVVVPAQHRYADRSTAPVWVSDARPTAGQLAPAPRRAYYDRARSYDNGCHVSESVVAPRACTYGDPAGDKRVLVFGDSHITQWLGAFDRAGRAHGWRVIALTKSHCPAVDATVGRYGNNLLFRTCDTWRRNAFTWMRQQNRFDLIIAGSYGQHTVFSRASGARLWGSAADAEWGRATTRTAKVIANRGRAVLWTRALPEWGFDVPACVTRYPTAVARCDRYAAGLYAGIDARWAVEAAAVAAFPKVTAHDFQNLLCPHGICPVTTGRRLKYRDTNHITNSYAVSLAGPVGRVLATAMR